MGFEALLPLLVAAITLLALLRRVDLYPLLVEGAGDGVRVVLRIFPALVVLFFAVNMLKSSGAYVFLCDLMAPVITLAGIPKETAPLLLIRPISGSGALAVAADLIATYGPDSTVGRTAAVMMGSTETTFYALSVYLGAVKVEKSWKILVSALAADLVGFLTASAAVRLFFS